MATYVPMSFISHKVTVFLQYCKQKKGWKECWKEGCQPIEVFSELTQFYN